MFDLLSDVIFWLKNNESEVVCVNKKFIEHIGTHSLNQVLGKFDLAYFPPHIARQFINDIRLENVRRMLIETRLLIAEVAYRFGFSEYSYFSRQFRLMFGTLPFQLTENMQQNTVGNLPT